MDEKYILVGRGIPSIIPNDQTTPGTRLTATEARQYARRLVELADELTPADPPPAPSADDARIAEIREWTTSVWAQDEFVYVAEDIRFLLARLDDFTKWKESADTVLLDHAALLHDDLKDFGSPAQNLREVVMGIVARLDVVTKERDQLRQRNDYLRARLNVYLQESTDG